VLATQTKLNGVPVSQLLKRPNFDATNLPPELLSLLPFTIWQLVETDFKYEGYAARQAEQNRQVERTQQQVIPDWLDYDAIPGLRSETRQKLATTRPNSLGQAARISGITPADIAIISIWLSKNSLYRISAAE
jgi:tRNA uridine 5-carboxymethylaminomethyl modification enzyme